MARTRKIIDTVNKAYGVGIILGHQNWVRAADDAPQRICVGCKEVVATGHNPNEQEIADHIWDMLVEAGVQWKESPAGKADDEDDLENGELVWKLFGVGGRKWMATNRGRKYVIAPVGKSAYSLEVTSPDFEHFDTHYSMEEAITAANAIEAEEQLRGIL